MANFVQLKDVEDWVNEYPERGVADLRHALAIRSFQGSNDLMARSWLELHDRKEREDAEREMRAHSKRAADAAWWSARTAFIALIASVASLLISAWPHIKF